MRKKLSRPTTYQTVNIDLDVFNMSCIGNNSPGRINEIFNDCCKCEARGHKCKIEYLFESYKLNWKIPFTESINWNFPSPDIIHENHSLLFSHNIFQKKILFNHQAFFFTNVI